MDDRPYPAPGGSEATSRHVVRRCRATQGRRHPEARRRSTGEDRGGGCRCGERLHDRDTGLFVGCGEQNLSIPDELRKIRRHRPDA
jgi:hypothetical protein